MSRLPKPSALTLWQAFGGIREAIAVLQTGSKTDVRGLCARSAGWDVPRREGGKDRPFVKLQAELRQRLLDAARRHLDAGATVTEIAASPRGKPGVARSDDPHPAVILHSDVEPSSTSAGAQATSAKRLLRIAPETHRVARSDDSHLAAASRAGAEPSSISSAARPTNAKRPLRIAPGTHRVARSYDSHLAAASRRRRFL